MVVGFDAFYRPTDLTGLFFQPTVAKSNRDGKLGPVMAEKWRKAATGSRRPQSAITPYTSMAMPHRRCSRNMQRRRRGGALVRHHASEPFEGGQRRWRGGTFSLLRPLPFEDFDQLSARYCPTPVDLHRRQIALVDGFLGLAGRAADGGSNGCNAP